MTNINDSVKQILCEGEGGEVISREFDRPLIERLKSKVYDLAIRLEQPQYKRLRRWLNGLEIMIAAIGAAGGFYLSYWGASENTKAVAWLVYIIVAVMIISTVRILPQEIEQFELEVKNLRLTILAERLAAKVVLFDLLTAIDSTDNRMIIERVSNFIPETEGFDEHSQRTIQRCIQQDIIFKNPRETNIKVDPYRLTDKQRNDLQEIAQQLVMLSGHLFVGRDFTAKIFLRTEKKFNDKTVELLTSFAKFPTRGTDLFGSSWVKARGNPSAVWESLEQGKPIVKSATEHNKNYAQVLAICLPGRIGVLSLTSSQSTAFKGFEEHWTATTRSLAAATRQLAISALELDK